jgi:arylsulfatase A-like enzyme/Flp pilus assembly protein TadD
MNYRSFIRLLLSVILALTAVSCGGPGGEPESHTAAGRPAAHDGPNLLLVTLDTVRSDRLGCYGRSEAMTPTIDRLAARGILLPLVSAPTPVTLPSHTTILTGSYPPGHGVRSNGVFTLAEDRHTMAEILGAAGYRTAAFVSAFVLDHRFGLDQGFETYDDRIPERDPLARFGFMAERRADQTCGSLIRWLEESSDDRPFFAWLHLFDPHQDYAAPEPYSGGSESERYDGEIAFTDLQLARVLVHLRRLGLLDHTLVVVTADHGQSLGEHGEDTHGLFIYESDTRVPLVFHLPGTVPEGALCHEEAHLADLLPTLLELVGLPGADDRSAGLRDQIQGRSIAAVLRGENGAGGNSRLYLETWHPRYNYGWSELSAIIRDGQKYVKAPTPELYDLAADPAELDNLLLHSGGRWSSRAREMADELEQLAIDLTVVSGRPAAGAGAADDETRAKLLALGYVIGGGSGSGVLSGPAPDPKDMVHLEEKLFLAATLSQLKRYEEALDVYLEVLAESPGGHNVRFKAGFLLQLLGRDQEAEEHYLHALQYYPDSEESHYNLGVICLRQERYPEALQWLSRAVSLAPYNALFQLDYGEALFRSGLVDKSISVFRHAAELDPALERAHYNLGLAASRKGDLTLAEGAYLRALELNPEFAEAHYALAACFQAAGRISEAAGHWRAYLELEPQGIHAEAVAARLHAVQ